MSYIHDIVVKDVTYSVAEAPATKQKTLLTLLSQRMMAGSSAAADPIDMVLLKATLMTLDEATLDKASDILLYKTFKVSDGNHEAVNVGSFQGRIDDYFTLLAEAVKANLADFIEWLDQVNGAERAKAAEPKARVL